MPITSLSFLVRKWKILEPIYPELPRIRYILFFNINLVAKTTWIHSNQSHKKNLKIQNTLFAKMVTTAQPYKTEYHNHLVHHLWRWKMEIFPNPPFMKQILHLKVPVILLLFTGSLFCEIPKAPSLFKGMLILQV